MRVPSQRMKLGTRVTRPSEEKSAAKLPEISRIEPNLTLEGLRLVWAVGHATHQNDFWFTARNH